MSGGLAWRPFTRADWATFGGCTSMGMQGPLLARLVVDGHDAVAVADAEGATVLVPDVDGVDFEFRTACHPTLALMRALQLQPITTRAAILALGFEDEDSPVFDR